MWLADGLWRSGSWLMVDGGWLLEGVSSLFSGFYRFIGVVFGGFPVGHCCCTPSGCCFMDGFLRWALPTVLLLHPFRVLLMCGSLKGGQLHRCFA